jgi:hypothetical protein
MIPVDRLDAGEDAWPSGEALADALDAGHLLRVEPLGSSVEYGWMAAFAASVTDARPQARLAAALDGPGAFRRFKHALLDASAERERWFAFRDARLHAAAREWLAEHGIAPATEPRAPA